MEEKKLDLSAPQYLYEKKIRTLFREDDEVNVEPLEQFTDTTYNLKIKVDNHYKAEAIEKLLPSKVTFGNTEVYIEIVPSNVTPSKIDLIKTAFEGNKALSFIGSSDVYSNPIHYVTFKKKVVQYYNDSMDNPYGLCSTLYQNIAKEVLGEDEGIFYCTDVADDCDYDDYD